MPCPAVSFKKRFYCSCVRTRIYIEDMRNKKVNEYAVTSERIVFVITANSNVMPTLRGFRWYPYFVAQE